MPSGLFCFLVFPEEKCFQNKGKRLWEPDFYGKLNPDSWPVKRRRRREWDDQKIYFRNPV